jgi:hypothetical protein
MKEWFRVRNVVPETPDCVEPAMHVSSFHALRARKAL